MARSRFLTRVTLSLALIFGAEVARGDVLYGIYSDGVADDNINRPLTWNFGNNSFVPGALSYVSPVLSQSGDDPPDYSSSASTGASADTADGLSLRGFAAASAANGSHDGDFSSAAGFGVSWYDTLIVGGSTGTKVQFKVSLALDSVELGGGQYSKSGVLSFVSITNRNDPAQTQSENVEGSPSSLTNNKSMIVDTEAGAVLELISALQGYAQAVAVGLPMGVGFGSASANASDTANTYITVLTPGASYTSASGVSYAAPAAVPEPRSSWLLAAALLTIGVTARLRRLHGPPGRTRCMTGN